MVRPLILVLQLCAVLAGGPASGRAVDLELVLAVDASASVRYGEYSLQMRGLAAAFRDPAVAAAIRAGTPGGLAVSLVQWSGVDAQAVLVDWALVEDPASAAAFADRIDAAPRGVRAGGTALGDAVLFGLAVLAANGFQGRRRVIDVSGDGRANVGTAPALARGRAVAAGVTVNGLAILDEEADLDRYYADNLIGGPGAFLQTADDSADFARAIRRKLITEISGGGSARLGPAFPGGRRLTESLPNPSNR